MKILSFTVCLSLVAFLASCQIDLMPKTSYYDKEISVDSTQATYSTRAEMEGLRKSLYGDNYLGKVSFVGSLYYWVMGDVRADNAYNGTSHAKLRDIESNNISAANEDVAVTWTRYFEQVSNANNIICNIDSVFNHDSSWTDETEKNQWKAEALIYRAFIWSRVTELWGAVPMSTQVPPAISADNIEKVYDLYYPKATPVEDIYKQIISDLSFACKWAPDTDPKNKGIFSKAFAHGLLARLYARNSSIRDWKKVDEECALVEACGYTLSPSFDNLWGYDPNGDAYRNNTETIFELQTNKSHGDRITYMLYYNHYSNKDNFTWEKYLTPSRDLIAAFEKEGDKEREAATITWDACGWSRYYPSSRYAFDWKVRTNASSIIYMRLAEIYLLHAEALAAEGNLAEATEYVNKVRRRVHLKEIAVPADYNAMVDLILHERRLELALEGFRFFDLARYGVDKLKSVCDNVQLKDSYWQTRRPYTETDLVLPIPQTELDKNPVLKQNEGY